MTSYPQICIFLTGALGDFINALPAFFLLREANPTSRIVLVGNPLWLPLAQADGSVDQVISMEALPLYAGFQVKLPRNHRLYRFLTDFDIIISWFGDAEGQWEKTLKSISQNNHVFPLHKHRSFPGHVSDYYISTLKKTGLIKIRKTQWPGFQLRTLTPAKNQERGILWENRPYLCLHPGSGAKKKNWPKEHFYTVAHTFYQQWKRPVAVLLGPAERDQKNYWEQLKRPFISILPNLSIVEAAHILSKASIYIGNDSGITHLAAAFGIPVIALFGPTDPNRWGPRGKQVKIIHKALSCSPCVNPDICTSPKKDCLDQITPKAVLKKIDEVRAGEN